MLFQYQSQASALLWISERGFESISRKFPHAKRIPFSNLTHEKERKRDFTLYSRNINANVRRNIRSSASLSVYCNSSTLQLTVYIRLVSVTYDVVLAGPDLKNHSPYLLYNSYCY